MQKWLLNIVLLLSVLFGSPLLAQNETQYLHKADSLYGKKKYAEAQQIYFQLYQQGYFSQSTLLKMAFVYEGLGDIPKALFFLTQYYNQTEDSKAYDKIMVLSNARNLKGYEMTDWDRTLMWMGNRSGSIISILLALAGLSFGLMLMASIKKLASLKIVFSVLSIFLFCVAILVVNLATPTLKGVTSKQTYIMNGPSPGSNFLTILDGGNQVPILSEEDVWVKINWNDKIGYVKKSDLLLN